MVKRWLAKSEGHLESSFAPFFVREFLMQHSAGHFGDANKCGRGHLATWRAVSDSKS